MVFCSDNLETAQRKRDRAQFTSNLESAADETPKSSRRQKKITGRTIVSTKTSSPNLNSTDSSSDEGPAITAKASVPFQSSLSANETRSTVTGLQGANIFNQPPPVTHLSATTPRVCANINQPEVDLTTLTAALQTIRTDLQQERERNERKYAFIL